MSYPPFGDFTVYVIQSGSSQSHLVLLFNLSSTHTSLRSWVLATSLISPANTFMLYKEKESERGRVDRDWTRRLFLRQGEFHTHTLVAYTGTRGWYSITAHYRLYLALFALPHAYTYEHTCLCANNPWTSSQPQAPWDQSTGNWQSWRLVAIQDKAREEKVLAENVIEIQDLLDTIGSYTI